MELGGAWDYKGSRLCWAAGLEVIGYRAKSWKAESP